MREYGSRATLDAAGQESDARIRGREQGIRDTLKAVSLAIGVSEAVLEDTLSTDSELRAAALKAIAAAADEESNRVKAEQSGDQNG